MPYDHAAPHRGDRYSSPTFSTSRPPFRLTFHRDCGIFREGSRQASTAARSCESAAEVISLYRLRPGREKHVKHAGVSSARRSPRWGRGVKAIAQAVRAAQFEGLEARRLFAAGVLDPSFDGDGIAITDYNAASTADRGNALAVQSDGKIIVVGSTGDGGNTQDDFLLVRYNTNGSLDTTFGGGTGMVTTNFGSADFA